MREDEAGKPTQSEYDQLYNSPEIQYLAETQVSIGSVGTPVTAASSTAACYDKTKNTKPSAASHGQACGSCWAMKIAMTESLRFGLVAVTSTPFPEPFCLWRMGPRPLHCGALGVRRRAQENGCTAIGYDH